MYKCKQKDHGRRMLRREAVDRCTWPMMTTMAASHKGDTRTDEVFSMRTNGNAGRYVCKAGKRSLFRRSGLTVKCQTAETGRGTASLSQGAHRLHWEEKKKSLSGDRCFPQI